MSSRQLKARELRRGDEIIITVMGGQEILTVDDVDLGAGRVSLRLAWGLHIPRDPFWDNFEPDCLLTVTTETINNRRGMMPETYDNELRGVLFSQEAETERHPNLTGKVQIGGVEYRLAAWKRTSAAGTNYLSLKVSVPEPQTVPASNPRDEITDF